MHEQGRGYLRPFDKDSFWGAAMDTMATVGRWLRNALAILGVLAIGYWLGSSRGVKAASYSGDVEFQLTGVNENRSVLLYQPSTKTVYGYTGGRGGNSVLPW